MPNLCPSNSISLLTTKTKTTKEKHNNQREKRNDLLELLGSDHTGSECWSWLDQISGSLSLCLVPYLSFPTEAHLGFARVGSDLGFVRVEFCLNNKIESNRLELYVEINFIVLNLEQRNQVYCTRDVSFLNIFENVLTNKIV